jgi:predicted alpha/beta-fold hydrolase
VTEPGGAFHRALWLPGGHAQTIVPSLLPARAVPGDADTLDVDVAPATKIRVLLHRPARPRGTVVLLHGLAGSAESRYMRRTGRLALERGWALARVNLRNCGGTEAMSATLYNAGQSGDAGAVLRALDDRGWPRPFGLVGFSLGGNMAVKYAGESGAESLADAVVGINPPIDLEACIDALERPANRIYNAYFTLGLCRHMARIRRIRPWAGPEATMRGGLRGFDDTFTAPDAGFANATEYYRASGAGRVLSGVRRPTLIVSAADDPFVPFEAFERFRTASSSVTFAHPRGGGHCGYWGATAPRYWAASAAIGFLDGVG